MPALTSHLVFVVAFGWNVLQPLHLRRGKQQSLLPVATAVTRSFAAKTQTEHPHLRGIGERAANEEING